MSQEFIIDMEVFIKYTRQPSNYEDYWSIFDTGAKFKMFAPEQLKRKTFFEDQLGTHVMGPFYHHLRKNKLLPGASEKQIIENIQQNKINHDDLILEFSNWLDQEDTLFVYMQKPKVETVKPTFTSFVPPPQQPTKTYNQPPKHNIENKKDQPFSFEKIPLSSPKTNIVGSYQQNTHYQKGTEKNQKEEDRPFRTRFLQKLADYFQYPERAVSIRTDINQIFSTAYKKI